MHSLLVIEVGRKIVKRFYVAFLFAVSVAESAALVVVAPRVASAEELRLSSVPKVYLGPDGERITMLEVNGSSQMLVQFAGVGGKWEGTTQLWKLETVGNDRKNVYFDIVVDQNPRRYTALVFLAGRWFAYLPERANRSIDLYYSTEASKDVKAESLISSRMKTTTTDGGKS
jgi:hypothetical protein